MQEKFACRPMRVDDLKDVIRIQAEAYIDEILETDEVIRARFTHTADTSWVIEREAKVCGYLVGYQSVLGEVSPWGSEFTHKPDASTLYLHDLAISKSAAGCGLGPMLVTHALAVASQRALRSAALVSVQNSQSFWEKLGFKKSIQLDECQRQNLASYAGPAIYMVRELSS